MAREKIYVPGISEAIEAAGVPLVPVTRANGFVFVSGMPPLDLEDGGFVVGDIQKETLLALEHVEACLEAAGCSLEDVLKVRVYAPPDEYDAINEAYSQVFEDPPARTFVPTPDLPIPADLEIECVASE